MVGTLADGNIVSESLEFDLRSRMAEARMEAVVLSQASAVYPSMGWQVLLRASDEGAA